MKNKANLFLLIFLLSQLSLHACEVCQNKQPKVLKGISHGTGPQDNLDYVLIWSAVILVVVTLILSLKFLLKPGENNKNHIKKIVINP